MADDPRREPDEPRRESGVYRVPDPVAIPQGREDDPFFGFVSRQEARRDFILVEILEQLGEAHAERKQMREDEQQRRAGEAERRATYEEERHDTLNRLQQIAGVVRDHSLTMGQVVQSLEKIQRCIRKMEDAVELVRQQQVSHGKELARVGSEVRGLSDHFEVAMTNTRQTVHSNEERLEQVEHDLNNMKQVLEAIADTVDELCGLVKTEDPYRSRRRLLAQSEEHGSAPATPTIRPGPTADPAGPSGGPAKE